MSDARERLYLDNAATSHPKPAGVVEAMSAFLLEVGGAPARGGHAEALGASRVVHRTRSALARLIGAPDASRVTFQPGATAALNLALAGSLGAGERVVTTDMEHNAVRRPLHRLARERGVVVDEIATARRSDAEVLEALDAALAHRPRMVAVQHASNVNGRVLPLAAMGERIARTDATFLVDAAQSAGAVPIDVVAMGVHLLALPGHKGLLGPQGVGALWVAPGHEPAPLVVGGTGSRSEADEPPAELPERYESGTLNAVGIAGLGAALAWIEERGVEALGHRERARTAELEDALARLPGVRVVGVPEGAARTGVVSVTFDELDPAIVGELLDRDHGIATRAGLHCAPSAHRALGTFPVGTLRFSVGPTTTSGDVERAASALARLLERSSDRIAV